MEDTDILNDTAAPSSLVPCSICGRTFRPEALERHTKICQKTAAKKIKVFDSSKQRAEGTEITQLPPPKKSQVKKEKPKPKSNWRQQHEEFIRAIRAAKGTEDDEGDVPNTNQPHVPVGYVPCPSCGRNFSERAADRHIPWCQNQKTLTVKSPVSNNDAASERMKLRTKYRAPVPGKKELGSKTSPISSAYSSKGSGSFNSPGSLAPSPVPHAQDDDHNNNRGDANNNSKNRMAASNIKRNEKEKATKDFKRPKQLPKKTVVKANQKNSEAPSVRRVHIAIGKENQNQKPSKTTSHPIMKFKEKFPNSNYRSFTMDENYEGYMLRSNNTYSRTPRTVPGVRTGGQATLLANQEKNNLWRNHRQENEDDKNILQSRFEDLGSNFRHLNGDSDASWAKKLNHWDTNGEGLPQIGSSEVLSHYNAVNINDLYSGSDTRVSTGSSSGDDGSLPPISRGNSTDGNRMPRFCHQCGTKYPVNGAKYCCECGARRLASAGGLTGQVV